MVFTHLAAFGSLKCRSRLSFTLVEDVVREGGAEGRQSGELYRAPRTRKSYDLICRTVMLMSASLYLSQSFTSLVNSVVG